MKFTKETFKGLRSTFAFIVFIAGIFWAGKIFNVEAYKIFTQYSFYAFLVNIGRKRVYAIEGILKKVV